MTKRTYLQNVAGKNHVQTHSSRFTGFIRTYIYKSYLSLWKNGNE